MILPDFVLPSRVNQCWRYSGIDSLKHCSNKNHFLSYPYSINYVYNSRGYRDAEWPTTLEELKQAVWCVGDSFTVGIGQPFTHTWPHVLSQQLNKRTINVGLDGASNDWIARKVRRIVEVVNPKIIVIMWSYTHRRELDNHLLNDEDRRLATSKDSFDDDYLNWVNLVRGTYFYDTKIIHLTIPDFHHITTSTTEKLWNDVKGNSWPLCPTNIQDIKNLPDYIVDELKNFHKCYDEIKARIEHINKIKNVSINNIIHIKERLDWARDYHHFDILTAQWLVHQICNQLLD